MRQTPAEDRYSCLGCGFSMSGKVVHVVGKLVRTVAAD
jgi:hypothetical protein